MRKLLLIVMIAMSVGAKAQIGEHRSDFAVGVGGGYVFSSIGFVPKVVQGQHGGLTGGLALRYTCEKYFKMICSIYAEVNYAQLGWKENILDAEDNKVVNTITGLTEEYSRTINYVQVPIMANLAWGKENRGMKFFVNLGPQFGMYLSESTEMNFDLESRNIVDRANTIIAQDTMAVENKFDYGIAVGLGAEYSHPRLGHFLAEARYYYGLGNIYGDSKRDYFGKSNFGNIVFRSYLPL